MVKKINIALLCVFAILFALKTLRDLSSGKGRTAGPDPEPRAETPGSDLEVQFYCEHEPPFVSVDVITRRDGLFLDQIRAIFPKVRLVFCDETNRVDWSIRALRSNPHAIAFATREDPRFADFGKTESALGWVEYRFITYRTNPWRYTGPESLAGKKFLLDVATCKNGDILRLDKEGVVETLDLIGPTCDYERLLGEDRYEGILCPYARMEHFRMEESGTVDSENFRCSPRFTACEIRLAVSSLDPEFAKRFLAEFESGFKRISESGERRRIFEYYGARMEQ